MDTQNNVRLFNETSFFTLFLSNFALIARNKTDPMS